MKELTFTLLIFFLVANLSAQNLVPNYSFESYTSCPTNWSQLNSADPWFQVGSGTPDYFNVCGTGPVSIPTNFAGSQEPLTGSGYAGMIISVATNTGNEYLTAPLVSPLTANACYYGEMYVSMGEEFSSIAVDKVGMYLTDGIPSVAWGEIHASPAPQIYSNSIISEAENWVQISGVFVATGDETHITLGNFFTDSEVNYEEVSGGFPGGLSSYYYIDNVSVVEVNENTTIDYLMCEGDCVTVAGQEFCDEGTYTVTIAECTSGNNSFTVNITTQSTEQIVIEPVSGLDCTVASNTLDASGSTGLSEASAYGWTGPDFSSTEAVVDVEEPGWYTFSIATSAGCTVKDSIEIIGDFESPELSIAPTDNWDCVSSNITITGSSTTPGASYQWTGPGTNATTSSISVNQTGVYQLVITGPNGCTEIGTTAVPEEYFTIPEAIATSTGILDCYTTEVNLLGSTNITSGTYLWTGRVLMKQP